MASGTRNKADKLTDLRGLGDARVALLSLFLLQLFLLLSELLVCIVEALVLSLGGNDAGLAMSEKPWQ